MTMVPIGRIPDDDTAQPSTDIKGQLETAIRIYKEILAIYDRMDAEAAGRPGE